MNVEGFNIDPPAGFRTEEMTVGMRMGPPGNRVAPSMIVQSKLAREGATLDALAAETLVELIQTVPNIKNPSKTEFTFADGGTGMVLAYNFTAKTGDLRQYFVLRLHEGKLCSVTLTIPSSSLTEANGKSFMDAIASLKPA
jgi:hypothetical protein